MSRMTFPSERAHESIRSRVEGYHKSALDEVTQAVEAEDAVIVGMAVNPHVKKARKLLEKHNISYKYLAYGGYFSDWKKRLAIKMWSGWPTFPMIFIKGQLIGGASDLKKLIEAGELQKLLDG